MGLDEFITDILFPSPDDKELNLTKAQVNARYVVSEDLPQFNGDSKEWSSFIAKLRETTKLCGLTATENLERLS